MSKLTAEQLTKLNAETKASSMDGKEVILRGVVTAIPTGEMTVVQAIRISTIAKTRGQGISVYTIGENNEFLVWGSEEEIQPHQQSFPACYWTYMPVSKVWSYESSTGNTVCSVTTGGTVVGQTKTELERLSDGGDICRGINEWESHTRRCVMSSDGPRVADLATGLGPHGYKAADLAALAIFLGEEEWVDLSTEWNG
jgi:hypothetical protein